MRKIITCLMFAASSVSFAQTTSIPDPGFEEWLIDNAIDSDNIINGQMLTGDAAAVTELTISGWDGNSSYTINNLSGLEAFTALERLSINFTQITDLDVTHNPQLKELRCGTNEISQLDLSANTLLEIIDIGTGGDVGPFNAIQVLDLSANPNINTVLAYDCYNLEIINLRNGANDTDMTIDIGLYPDWTPEEPHNDVCIEIDDEQAAQAGQLPYSAWNIAHSDVTYQLLESCELGLTGFKPEDLSVYPNPCKSMVTASATSTIQEIVFFDTAGRKVLEQRGNNSNELTIITSSLGAGTYIVKIVADKVLTQKLIVM